jgi:hypothetical protein
MTAITSTARTAKRDMDIERPPPEDVCIRAFSLALGYKPADK